MSVCLWLRSDLKVFCFVLRRSWRLWPRRTCGFVWCIVLTGTNEGLRVQEFLRDLVVGVAVRSDLVGSIIVEILHSREGVDVEQVARTSKQISRACNCLFLSLSLSLMFIYLACFYCLYSHMLDILVLYWYTCLGYLISCMLFYWSYPYMLDIVILLVCIFVSKQES